jgi:hypothetical protein
LKFLAGVCVKRPVNGFGGRRGEYCYSLAGLLIESADNRRKVAGPLLGKLGTPGYALFSIGAPTLLPHSVHEPS